MVRGTNSQGSDSSKHVESDSIDRRKLLKVMGTAGVATSIAGCSGGQQSDGGDGGDGGGGDGGDGGGGGSGELGERVPELKFRFHVFGGVYEASAPIVAEAAENLGFDIEVQSGRYGPSIEEASNDERSFDFWLFGYAPVPRRLDPHEFLRPFAADWAGADGNPNLSNYANCEFTTPAIDQATAPSESARRELVNQAQQVFSEDYATIPLLSYFSAGGYRSDLLDVNGLGEKKLVNSNVDWLINSSPKQGSSISVGRSEAFESINWYRTNISNEFVLMNRVPNSPLVGYDQNWERQNILAEDVSLMNEGKRIEVTLRDGSFTNGDPITAEDVKFTMEHIENNFGSYPLLTQQGYADITTPDDKTIVFDFEEPNPRFITLHLVSTGITSKKMWEQQDAVDDPSNFVPSASEFIGSGPFNVVGFSQSSQLSLEPHDGHPFYDTPNADVNIVAFSETQAKTTALSEGDVQAVYNVGTGPLDRLERQLPDQFEPIIATQFGPRLLQMQHSFGPSKFREFRKALAIAIDRQKMNAVAFNGQADLWFDVSMFHDTHPWKAPDDMLTTVDTPPEGDVEKAKGVLQDAGWQQDNNGNWHYPADADLSPAWPKGEQPTGDEFACLTSEGEYASD